MCRLALQIQRHIYNSAYVPRVRVMASIDADFMGAIAPMAKTLISV